MESDYLIRKKPMQALLIFSLPIILGNLFQQTYTMADSAIVGRFVSEQALAAVGASYSLTNIFICVAIGGGMGASVIVGRHFGAKQYREMKAAIYTACLAFLAVSVLLGGLGLLFSRQIMTALNTPEDVMGMAGTVSEYLFLRSAVPVYVQRAFLHVQCSGEVPDSALFPDFFFCVQCGAGSGAGNTV